MIKQFGSIYALVEHANQLIDSNRLDHALHLVYDCVEQVLTEPMCTAKVIGSVSLDNLCQKVGERNLTSIDRNTLLFDTHTEQSVFVYIVTKLQRSGGHTRVIEDFIKARPHARHFVLSTELAGRSDDTFLRNRLADQIDISFEFAHKHTSYQQRLTWLQRRLLEIHPKKIYLFNHHQDSVSIAAIQQNMGFEVAFYHHGDHHLCLGVHLHYAEHIDPHPMGYYACRQDIGIDNVYIPLTLDDKGARPQDWPFMQDGILTTCTAARSNKIEIPYFVSYMDVVPKLLKATGGKHIHIGRLTPWALFRIKRRLKRLGITEDRFVYIPWVSSVWEALHKYRIDLYIASFPYGGGLTMIEAMGAGIPVVLHRHLYSRVLAGIDLGYPEVFSWRTPQELLNYCSNLTPQILSTCSRQSRAQYNQYHRPDELAIRLNNPESQKVMPLNLTGNFIQASDERAYWMTQQVTIWGCTRRNIYRFFRYFRSKYF